MRKRDVPRTGTARIAKRDSINLAQHLSKRCGLTRAERLDFTAWLVGLPAHSLSSTDDLTPGEGAMALERLTGTVELRPLVDQWRVARHTERQSIPTEDATRAYLGN
ncbi:hypothetical protein Deipe_1577 [Deinococcus peraridilitoris DSM 19664]|uniref:Uncharacterized protein n=1 Tax=Deinococcus peraridilitoris (strain DSM 19664 / LMG 22246 / CIP 109416 / KR-200) TaxID=937777 RepID=K9ZZS3_DEIPD|nr:hypothetical protein Deipe_1577 [Deinococcus peraridilitoris DSM 19664]